MHEVFSLLVQVGASVYVGISGHAQNRTRGGRNRCVTRHARSLLAPYAACTKTVGKDLPAALFEDVVAIVVPILIVRSLGNV